MVLVERWVEHPIPHAVSKFVIMVISAGGMLQRKKLVDNSVPDVAVVDSSRSFLGYTRRGKARKLVKEGKAKWLQVDPNPVLIYLIKSPSADVSDYRPYRRNNMQNQREVHPVRTATPGQVSGKAVVTNWTEFFKEARDIYVQNVSTFQVSVEFETTPGNKIGFLFPNSRDPVNLTQFIPFEAIKASVDFRKMLSRRPPALALMTDEEYIAYFQRKAESHSVSVEQAIDQATTRLQKIHNKQDYTTDSKPEPLHKVVEDNSHFGGQKRVASSEVYSADEVIHPRVLHLCQQVNPEVDDKDKMRANVIIDELKAIDNELKLDDWEYIRSHGYWRVVKNFAKEAIGKLVGEESGEGAEDNYA